MKKRPNLAPLDGSTQAVVLVDDVARAARFYQEDLRLEAKDGDGVRFVELATGDNASLVIVRREGSLAPLASVATAGSPKTLTFVITADAYGRWKQWLTKRGIEIAQEIKWVHGGRSLYLFDPDGNRIEFKASPPPAKEEKAGSVRDASPAAAVGATEATPAAPPPAAPKPEESARTSHAPEEKAATKLAEAEKPTPVKSRVEPATTPSPRATKDGKSAAPPIQGVLETVLYVGDLARALAFYRDVVGLKPMQGEAGRFQAFDAGGPGRVLLLFARGTTLEPAPAPLGMIPPHDGSGPQHIAFGIGAGDYNAWRAHLRTQGVAIESETGWDLGGRSIYFRDPDKHLVELATPGIWPNF